LEKLNRLVLDKFQGQQAPWCFYGNFERRRCFAQSRISFLPHRLNAAISHAQCLAYLVCSPLLLGARCNSIEEMELVNALCRLAEYAERKPV
jgi:uncharacterized protein